MQRLSINKVVEFKWVFLDNYYITPTREIYYIKTMRKKKRTVKNSTIGYWIGRKFYSLPQINKLAKPIPKQIIPF